MVQTQFPNLIFLPCRLIASQIKWRWRHLLLLSIQLYCQCCPFRVVEGKGW